MKSVVDVRRLDDHKIELEVEFAANELKGREKGEVLLTFNWNKIGLEKSRSGVGENHLSFSWKLPHL